MEYIEGDTVSFKKPVAVACGHQACLLTNAIYWIKIVPFKLQVKMTKKDRS